MPNLKKFSKVHLTTVSPKIFPKSYLFLNSKFLEVLSFYHFPLFYISYFYKRETLKTESKITNFGTQHKTTKVKIIILTPLFIAVNPKIRQKSKIYREQTTMQHFSLYVFRTCVASMFFPKDCRNVKIFFRHHQ